MHNSSAQSRKCMPHFFCSKCIIVYLECQIMVLLLLLRAKGIPPFSQNLADCPVVLVRVPLVYQCSMTLTEDHKRIHWPSDVVLLPLKVWKQYLRMREYIWIEQRCLMFLKSTDVPTFPGLFLSPSLGSALRDWVRLFTGDVERGCSGTTPGRKLKEHSFHICSLY